MKKIISLLILTIISLFASSCENLKVYSNYSIYFGTEMSVTIYSNSKKKAQKYLDYSNDLFKEYSDLSDRFFSHQGINGIYKINNSGGEEIKIDKKLFDLIEFAINKSKEILDENNLPYFEIGVGTLSDLYKDYYNNEEVLEFNVDTSKINTTTDSSKIILNKEKSTIIIPKDMKIDLGGIAKGYAVELLREYYDTENVKYIINAGSSNIVTNIGNPERKNNEYLVGLFNPNYIFDNSIDMVYAILNVPKNKAVVTSGDYQKYFIYNNKIYSSIIDPRTFLPVETDIRSITILVDRNDTGDILSTTLFMMGSAKATKYLNENNIDAIIYKNNDEIVYLNNIRKYIKS